MTSSGHRQRPFFSAQAKKKAIAANLKDPGVARAVEGRLARLG